MAAADGSRRSVERITVVSTPATTVAREAVEATAEADLAPTIRPTPAPEEDVQPSQTASASVTTIDCSSMARLTGAVLLTSIRPTPTQKASDAMLENFVKPTDKATDKRMMRGMEVYSFRGCLWARSLIGHGHQESLTRLCTVTCPARNADGAIVRRAALDDLTWTEVEQGVHL